MNPEDLDGLSCDEIVEKLFGRVPANGGWWSLEYIKDRRFLLKDDRLLLSLKVSPGFLIALHEVSSYEHSREFAKRNGVRILQDRGLFIRGVAEVAIKCDGIPPIMTQGKERYKIEFSDGVEATIAHASFLFQRLIALPSAEVNSTLPDPGVLTTLVLNGVDVDNATDIAERSLFALRESFPENSFEFVPLTSQSVLGDNLEDVAVQYNSVATPFATEHPWAIAFFNRASEAEPLAAFLYYYRVLEACFDIVISEKLNAWRSNESLGATELLKEVRSIARIEDTFALRQVLGHLVDQPLLDDALAVSIIDVATVDALTSKLYSRRNEIAHGRRGQHQHVLVPYSFPLNSLADRDIEWQRVMRVLARKAIKHWLTSAH
ncbi:hypothetical protein [Xanthomonas arboricola]|uniref:hypothetical protein n=1 Tax=Xanthomonas arboricola TaxID=56448 RepID=UPI0011B0E724|nr:hypothetical protein [Xanthomonas arboricola]